MFQVTLRQLQVFETVARQLSYSRAAEVLYLSQPAVSMQIKQLEESIGLPLFEQMGKKIYLTEAGKELFQCSCAIAQQLADVSTIFSDMKGLERGHLNISVVNSASYFMPQLLAKFIQLHPKINVSMHVANRDAVLKQLSENSADLAVMGQPPEETDMLAQPFMQNPLVVIAAPGHPLARAKAIQPQRLAQETFLLREHGSGTRSVMERFFAGHRVTLSATMEMDTNESIKQAVQAGIGLGIISLHGIELELETGRLKVLDVEHFPIMRHWHIVHRRNKRLSVAAQAFQQFLLAEAKRLTPDPTGKRRLKPAQKHRE